MTSFRIESSCARTGAYQYTAVADTARGAHLHCAEPWRAESVHVVFACRPGLPALVAAVYCAGRRVSPLLPWSGES